MPYPMAAARGSKSPLVAVIPPSYWLVFDGSNDYITLPSSHGQEPSTAIFIEAWVKDVPGTSAKSIITRGDFYTNGYHLSVSRADEANKPLAFRQTLKDVDNPLSSIGYAGVDLSLPTHVATGYDGAAYYYFVNGVLVATSAETGTIGYDGNMWTIGDMLQGGGPVWPFSGKMTQLRVSDVCRHTASFVPPTTFTSDANTVGLWLAREGAGTALADSGPGAHHGTFKGTGEPAWGDVADLTKLSYGEDMWDALADVVPAVTDTNIYLHRVSADEYEVFRKVHATGPYWVKWVYGRVPEAGLMPVACYTGVPDPANDTPSSWTTDPATRLLEQTTEYVFYGTSAGSVNHDWGSGHNTDEQLSSEAWAVDGTPVALENDAWANGSVITYTADTYYVDPEIEETVCNLTKTHTYDKTVMWVDREYTFNWLIDWEPGGVADAAQFPLMASVTAANLTTFTSVPGGTDIAIATGGYADVRSHAGAAWKADNGCIFGLWIDFVDGQRYLANNMNLVVNATSKIYMNRADEIHGAQAETSWHYHTRYLALDNCGNHFLKTT